MLPGATSRPDLGVFRDRAVVDHIPIHLEPEPRLGRRMHMPFAVNLDHVPPEGAPLVGQRLVHQIQASR